MGWKWCIVMVVVVSNIAIVAKQKLPIALEALKTRLPN